MKKLLKILDLTVEEYQDVYLEKYLRWTENLAHNHTGHQQALANTAISKYYNAELEKCETEFLKLVSRYEGSDTVSVKEFRRLYDRCTYELFSRYPKPLLENARKLSIENDISAN